MKITKRRTIALLLSVIIVGAALPVLAYAVGTQVEDGTDAALSITARSCLGYVDADGDGVCDNVGRGIGACLGYVDADGDGVCDNVGAGTNADSTAIDAAATEQRPAGNGMCGGRGQGLGNCLGKTTRGGYWS